jgi:hypothetical protein
MTLPIETTPTALTPKIAEFCRSVVPDQPAAFIPVQPADGAERDRSLENVARYAAQFAGTTVLGWRIWERPGINLHAAFYAVWKAGNGELIDVSPQPNGESQILFLPDPRLVWEGKWIEGHSSPLLHWREVQDYLAANARVQKMRQAGASAEYLSAGKELKRATAALEKRLAKSK